jgi:hypothetical protein
VFGHDAFMADSGTCISSSVSYRERAALRPFPGLPCKSPVRLIACMNASTPDRREFRTTPKKPTERGELRET